MEISTVAYMSHNLNSLKGGYIGDYIWDYYRVTKGDTRSLDCSSHELSSTGQVFDQYVRSLPSLAEAERESVKVVKGFRV